MLRLKLSLPVLLLLISLFLVAALPPLITAALPGDANSDSRVDGIDYVIWLNHYNQQTTGASSGDFNNNGFVDGLDYVIWLNNYNKIGNISPTPDKITFTASNEDFANPERGFMKQSAIFLDQPLDPGKITALQSPDTVVWIYFRLDNYRDPRDGIGITLSNYQYKPLDPLGSGKGLDTVKATFAEARKKGLKLIIRFIYNWGGPDSSSDPMKVNPDVPLDVALKHLGQVSPLIAADIDVIAAVQVGFVGYWGEWHGSKYLDSLADRKIIIDALLAAVPKVRMLMLRYPLYKQLWYGGPLTDILAYSQTDVSRVGYHNDCFVSNDTDGGTYKSSAYGIKMSAYCDGYPAGETQCWKDFVSKDSRFLPMGGETCQIYSSPRSDCPNVLSEMANFHWSFINNGFNCVHNERFCVFLQGGAYIVKPLRC